MKLAKITLALTALATATSALAGTVTGSSNLSILAFDGVKLKRNATVQINDSAQHQVVVEVATIYESNGSNSAYFTSKPMVLTFEGSPEDIQISAPSLRSSYDVEKFQKNPNIKIQTSSGKQLSYKQDFLSGEGFMPNANLTDNLAQYNNGSGVAAVKKFAVGSVVTLDKQGSKAKAQGENIAEQQLRYWFEQADKETQARFLKWANQ